MYGCDATVLLNVYIHLVFLGNGYAALVPSNLPHLTLLSLMWCENVRDEYVKELEAAVPKVLFSKGPIISRYTFVLCIPVIY